MTEAASKRWIDSDPDPETIEELQGLPESELKDRFSGQLKFGTAGLRAPLGAGPQRMNRLVVRFATQGLMNALGNREKTGSQKAGSQKAEPTEKAGSQKTTPKKIIVGYDARRKSDVFAADAAQIAAAAGAEAYLFDRYVPTPVLAHAAKSMGADAGIMVTASHNPPQDNGYKVYWSDGAQINSAEAVMVEREMAKEMNKAELLPRDIPAERIADLSEGEIENYTDAVMTELGQLKIEAASDTKTGVKIVYTPMHGVGGFTLSNLFQKMGLGQPIPVESQSEPDGGFPTVSFPNPQEPGAMDLALQLATESQADLVLANDPDADRLAVAVPMKGSSGNDPDWYVLTGNEIGFLLADCLLSKTADPADSVVATTLVSSSLLSKMAKDRGAIYRETLTGFKWIARAADKDTAKFIFGYEEALGYSVLPELVRDKDGISAAAVFTCMTASLAEEGKSPLDRLDEIYQTYGLHMTDEVSFRFDEGQGPLAAMHKLADAMGKLRENLPSQIGDIKVVSITDYAQKSESPEGRVSNTVAFHLENGTRLLFRPSGTEPKLKVYLEIIEMPKSGNIAAARQNCLQNLEKVKAGVGDYMNRQILPEK